MSQGFFQIHFLLRWRLARLKWWHTILVVPPTIVLIALIILIIISNPGPDSNSDYGTCSDMYYLHIVHVVVDSAHDSHTVLALLSFVLTENL